MTTIDNGGSALRKEWPGRAVGSVKQCALKGATMHPAVIKKTLANLPLAPNWLDSVQARQAFSWEVEAQNIHL